MNHEPNLPEELVDLLPLWIGGDLDDDVADRVAQAVADSDELAGRAEALAAARAALLDGLATSVELDPAPDLWPGVRAALEAEGLLADAAPEPHAEPAGQVLPFRRAERAAGLRRVAVAALVLVGSALAWRSFAGSDAPDGGVDPAAVGPVAVSSEEGSPVRGGGSGSGGSGSGGFDGEGTGGGAMLVANEGVPTEGPTLDVRPAVEGLVPLGERPSLRDGERPLFYLNHGARAGTTPAEGTATLASDVR